MCGLHMAKQQFASGVVDWSIPMLCAQQEVVGGKHWTTCGGGPVEIGEEPFTVSVLWDFLCSYLALLGRLPSFWGKLQFLRLKSKL